jgi:serine/threonine protein kinase
MTKDSKTDEYIMIIKFANKGNLRSILSSNFKNFLWIDKISLLCDLLENVKNLHKLGIAHKDLHSGNILQDNYTTYVSDFELSVSVNEQNSDNRAVGVLPYIAPEVLKTEPYSLSSDIYSIGVIMVELSSGKPPFYKRIHDTLLAIEICKGVRPEFGKKTPEIYKKLAYRCMDDNPNMRPTTEELYSVISFWNKSINDYYYKNYQEKKDYGYIGKEVKAVFEEADKEIPNISTSYEKVTGAIYTSRAFTLENLAKPINSSIITSFYEGIYVTILILNNLYIYIIINFIVLHRLSRFTIN